jgi:hypothetical protein
MGLMPLKAGRQNFQRNIKEMIKAGHPKAQAVAAAYSKLRGDRGFYGHLGPNQEGECIKGGIDGELHKD